MFHSKKILNFLSDVRDYRHEQRAQKVIICCKWCISMPKNTGSRLFISSIWWAISYQEGRCGGRCRGRGGGWGRGRRTKGKD